MNSTGDYSIMLVDDNEIDCFINNKVIDKAEVAKEKVIFNSPLQALEYLQQEMPNTEKLPDVILLDIYMPQMNGFEFISEFEKIASEEAKEKCRFYLLSSTLDPRDLSKAKENKYVIKVLNKPLSIQVLQEIKEMNNRIVNK